MLPSAAFNLLSVLLFVVCPDGVFGDPLLRPSSSTAEEKRQSGNFNGYRVVRAYTKTRQEREALKADLNLTNAFFEDGDPLRRDHWDRLALWHPEFTDDDGFVDILASSGKVQDLEKILDAKRLDSDTLIEDLHWLVKRSFHPVDFEPWDSLDEKKDMSWKQYHSLATINAFLDNMAKKLPGKAEVAVIGKSYEGRDLRVLQVNSANANNSIWIDGATHAREWISPATVTYIINELVGNYEKHKSLVDSFQWHFFPVFNPDGYEYSRQSVETRFWRRNKALYDPSGQCIGVDLNRNWDFHWMEKGASQDFCAQTYAGPMPESEPEVVAVRDHVLGLRSNKESPLIAFYTIHSYGQLWCTPWGWSSENPPGYENLIRPAEAGVKAISGVHGKVYKAGTVASLFKDTFGLASGAADDWAYGKAKVPYVYTLEVRDDEHGKYLFLLPPDQIIPTGEEILAGLNASLLEILKIDKELKSGNGAKAKQDAPSAVFPTIVG